MDAMKEKTGWISYDAQQRNWVEKYSDYVEIGQIFCMLLRNQVERNF